LVAQTDGRRKVSRYERFVGLWVGNGGAPAPPEGPNSHANCASKFVCGVNFTGV